MVVRSDAVQATRTLDADPLLNWERHNSLPEPARMLSERCLEFLDNGFEFRFIGRRYCSGTKLTNSIFESREHSVCSHASGREFDMTPHNGLLAIMIGSIVVIPVSVSPLPVLTLLPTACALEVAIVFVVFS
jgi:hypothetical protein